MNTQPLPFRRLRTIFDCVLVTLLILFVVTKYLPVQARSEPRPPAAQVMAAGRGALSDPIPASANAARDRALLDATTSAAIIAAENAALTLPYFSLNLPAVIR